MNQQTDQKLASASKRGDKSAYAILVNRYYRRVFAVCLGIVGNVHDAEDVAQDTMLKGFVKISRLREKKNFGPWILRIAKNLCIDRLRRKQHVKTILAGRRAQNFARSREYPDLHYGIRQLPQELRVPLVMYYFDGKNTKNIAEMLDISRSGVCIKLREARRQLHELLTGESENEQRQES